MNRQAISDLQHVGFEGKQPPPSRPPHRWLESRTAPTPGPRAEPARAWGAEAGAEQHEFLGWLLRRAGLDPGVYRLEPLLRRLPACLRALKVQSPEEARQTLEAQPERLPAAIRILLIGVTGFFRDPAVFDGLRTAVLPALARRGGPLRVWSAACSSGAELYSVAILLAEAGLLERSFLLGTDCRADAIAQAEAALYGEDVLLDVPPAWRARYFRCQGPHWRLALPPGGAVAWKTADLWARLEPGSWDLILFRNAAIYMAPQAVQRLWGDLAGALCPGGVLVVGKAERPAAGGLGLLKRCVYQKTDIGDSSHG